jgi:hypothetical protein
MRSAFTSLAASASVAGNHGHSSASASSVAGTSIPALPRNNLNQFGMSLFGNLKTDIEKMQQNIVSEDESRDHLFKMVRQHLENNEILDLSITLTMYVD